MPAQQTCRHSGAALGELGLVGGLSYADATTTAEANAIGIDGGAGNDTITNNGQIQATTQPSGKQRHHRFDGPGREGDGGSRVAYPDRWGDEGHRSGLQELPAARGTIRLTTSGRSTVKALPDADSGSVSVTLSAAKEGVAARRGFCRRHDHGPWRLLAGIEGGAGNDTINNTGRIEVTAEFGKQQAPASRFGRRHHDRRSSRRALSDGTINAISNATGIKGDDGNDTIKNSNFLTSVTSTADIDSASVSVNLGFAKTWPLRLV